MQSRVTLKVGASSIVGVKEFQPLFSLQSAIDYTCAAKRYILLIGILGSLYTSPRLMPWGDHFRIMLLSTTMEKKSKRKENCKIWKMQSARLPLSQTVMKKWMLPFLLQLY